MNYTIDATNKSLGRVATEVAAILLGKNTTNFAKNTVSGNTVTVTNASKIKVTPKKLLEKTYKSFSGYPGGLKIQTMAHVTETKGYKDVITTAIKGMLPNNRLRPVMMKNLSVTE